MALPPRIILLDGSGTLSLDVLSWLAEQGIKLARVKWTGVVATVGGSGYFDRAKVDWQRATRADETKRLTFAADLIWQKLLASIPTLQACFEPSRSRDIAPSKAEAGIERLRSKAFRNINDVFAIEGGCASAYFAAWNGLPIGWTGTARKPVGGVTLFDVAVDVPAARRRAGYVFQEPRLFPHLSVRANLLYGAADGDRLSATAAMLDIAPLLDR